MAATSNFSIDKFTGNSGLKAGGALGSLFQCHLMGAKGTGSNEDNFKFLCKGVSFPASTVDVATVTFMGRAVNIPSNRAAMQLTTSIYNDEGMEIRNHLENWLELINSHSTNKRSNNMMSILSYTGTMRIEQYSKDDKATKEYTFNNIWPSSTGEVALSWDTNDIQTYDVTWEYNYWSSVSDSGAGA